jgi:DNA-binding NtrC family response regulator
VARALHFEGVRRNSAFVRLDCAAAAPTQLEARLFGHEPGARVRRRGLLEAADGGTLYIDEIGQTPPALQTRLLDVLDHGAMRRVSGSQRIRLDVRVVAATRHPLRTLLREGRLQLGLYRRLVAMAPLQLAPLRERGDDLFLLANRFVEWHAKRHDKSLPRLADSARAALARHAWPDNVRELHHALERAVWLESDGVVGAEHIVLVPPSSAGMPAATAAAPEMSLRQLERDALVRALERSRGNVCGAARLLGVSRDTMRYRIAKHDLSALLPRWPGATQRVSAR